MEALLQHATREQKSLGEIISIFSTMTRRFVRDGLTVCWLCSNPIPIAGWWVPSLSIRTTDCRRREASYGEMRQRGIMAIRTIRTNPHIITSKKLITVPVLHCWWRNSFLILLEDSVKTIHRLITKMLTLLLRYVSQEGRSIISRNRLWYIMKASPMVPISTLVSNHIRSLISKGCLMTGERCLSPDMTPMV